MGQRLVERYRESHVTRGMRHSTCEASTFPFFSPRAWKNINLHYIAIITIKTCGYRCIRSVGTICSTHKDIMYWIHVKTVSAHRLDSFYSWELQRISVLWLMAVGAAVTVLHCRHTAMTLTGTLTDRLTD